MDTSLSILRLRRRASEEEEKERYMLRNGSMLLEELIHSCDGKYNPFRIFSAQDLAKATNDCRKQYADNGFYVRGTSNGCPILIVNTFNKHDMKFAINEVVFATQVNNHKNILMLLGCCLETETPILLYEYAEHGVLSKHIFKSSNNIHQQLLPWDCKLKVAKEIADALAYLHTGLSMPIIHGNVKPANIYLDFNYVAKLSNFCLCVSIPSGEEYVETDEIRGTFGYMAPEHFQTRQLTEKCDVYSFGSLMLEILSGERISTLFNGYNNSIAESSLASSIGGSDLVEVVEGRDPDWVVSDQIVIDQREKYMLQACMEAAEKYIGLNNMPESLRKQITASTELALKCNKDSPEERPTMKEAAQELRRIIKWQ